MSSIEWNRVTWYSKLLAVILGVVVLCMGIYIGMQLYATHLGFLSLW